MFPCYNEATSMRSADFEKDVSLCAEAGFGHMELRKEKLLTYLRGGHTLAQTKELLEARQIRPACINALQGTYMRTAQDRTLLRDACEFLCFCGRELGCRKLEYIAPYKVPIEDARELEDYTVESLTMLSDAARPYGVRIAMEYMGIPYNSVQTFRDALRIVDRVGRDNVGILLDTWHHYAWGSAPEDILEATGGQVFMVHISDAPERKKDSALLRTECIWPGEGAVPIRKDLEILKKIGYREEVSVEIFSPAVQSADPAAVIPKAFRHVSEILARL